jgi:hypothetical protein
MIFGFYRTSTAYLIRRQLLAGAYFNKKSLKENNDTPMKYAYVWI